MIGISVIGLVLVFIVVGAIVLLVTLLMNPKTRGAGLAFLGAGLVLTMLLVALLSFFYVSNEQRASADAQMRAIEARQRAVERQAAEEHAAAHPMAEIESFDEVAAVAEGDSDSASSDTIVYQQQFPARVAVDTSLTWAMIIPIAAIALVAIAFFRGNSSLGLALLGLIGGGVVLLLCVGWFWAAAPMSRNDTPREIALAEQDEAWGYVTAPQITLEVKASEDHANADAHAPSDAEAEDVGGTADSPPPAKAKPSERPDWLGDRYKKINNVVRRVVSSDPFSTIAECQQQLNERIDDEVALHVESLVGHRPWSLRSIDVPQSYIMGNCVSESFAERRQSPTGFDVWQQYVQLEFTPATDNYLIRQYQATQRAERVTGVALGGAGVMATLAMVLGLLRLDTATKGYYTKRLFIGVPLAIIASLGLLAFVT